MIMRTCLIIIILSLLGLEAFTTYDIAVAARTSAGLGPYSENERVQTNETNKYLESLLTQHYDCPMGCFYPFADSALQPTVPMYMYLHMYIGTYNTYIHVSSSVLQPCYIANSLL